MAQSVTSPSFRYLHDARECLRNEERQPCVVCGRSLPGYVVFLFPEATERNVCEPCLVGGRLAEVGLRVNEADADAVREQLAERGEPARALGTAEPVAPVSASVAEALTEEVEWRTPRPAIFHWFRWPAHCGDYAVFFRRVYADDLARLAPDGDGPAFLASHLHPAHADISEADLSVEWQYDLKGSIWFYLWRCSAYGQYLITTFSE